jgi:hypothetical protein
MTSPTAYKLSEALETNISSALCTSELNRKGQAKPEDFAVKCSLRLAGGWWRYRGHAWSFFEFITVKNHFERGQILKLNE